MPSAALTSNLYWLCREFELLGECGRILFCDSGVVISEATQLVHKTAHNSIRILPASILDAIPACGNAPGTVELYCILQDKMSRLGRQSI